LVLAILWGVVIILGLYIVVKEASFANINLSWLKRNSNRTIPDEEIGLMETDFGTF